MITVEDWLRPHVLRVFRDEEAELWMRNPNQLLDNLSPIEDIKHNGSQGIERVLALLDQLESGAFI